MTNEPEQHQPPSPRPSAHTLVPLQMQEIQRLNQENFLLRQRNLDLSALYNDAVVECIRLTGEISLLRSEKVTVPDDEGSSGEGSQE